MDLSTITWYGHASFKITDQTTGNNIYYIDPFNFPTESKFAPADLIFITHAHSDHLSFLDIEKLDGAHKAGDKLSFDKVLLTDDGSSTKVGSPYVDGAKVAAEFVEQGREDKVTVIRYRQKSRHFVKRGHRQPFTKVRITALP